MNFLTNILTVAQQIAAARGKSQAVAAQAGNRATSASPLTAVRREANYIQQNGTFASCGLTARQQRRVAHKSNLAAKRAGVSSPQPPKPLQPKPGAPKPA